MADLVFNAIYPEEEAKRRHYFGARYFCLREEFALTSPRPVATRVDRILVTFGGTDPNNLTKVVVDAIKGECHARDIEVIAVLGMGYRHDATALTANRVLRSIPNMADEMGAADLVFTSAGRTVFEVAAVGTPAIVLAQNARELTHTFARSAHGFLNLGLGTNVPAEEIRSQMISLLDDRTRRREMQERMLSVELEEGVHRVVRLMNQVINAR